MRSIFPKGRWQPAGSRKIAAKNSSAVAFVLERQGGSNPFVAIGYRGKREKAEFHFHFPSAERRQAWLVKWFAQVAEQEAAWDKRKAEKKVERSKPHSLKVGQVLVSSWGYDQTNVDFYEVVELVGKNSVKIVKIAGERYGEQGGEYYDRGYCIPSIEPDRAKGGEPMLKRVGADNSVKIASYAWARPWDGAKKYVSSYA